METNPGNSEKAAALIKSGPADRRVPLRIVVFTSPVPVPGLNAMVTTVEVGEYRLIGGKPVRCPRPFLDPVMRTIWIEGFEYPMERVVYWQRDKTGFMPEAKPLPDHTIGKRESRTETPGT